MMKVLGFLGVAFGAALLAPVAAMADTGPVHRQGGSVRFVLSEGDTLTVRGAGPGALTWSRTNGATTGTGQVDGFTRDLIIDGAGGGADILVRDLDVPGDLRIDTGDGPDTVRVGFFSAGLAGPVTVGADLRIDTGGGDDAITAIPTRVVGTTSIRGGRGNDTVWAGGSLGAGITRLEAGGPFTVDSGPGNDSVQMTWVGAQDDVRISTGGGDDSLTVGVPCCLGGAVGITADRGVAIDTGSGADTVLVRALTVAADVRLLTGSDDDTVSFGRSKLTDGVVVIVRGGATIDTGAGADQVSVPQAEIGGDLKVTSGDGADVVTLGNADGRAFTVAGPTSAQPGSGDDALTLDHTILTGLAVSAGRGDDQVDLVAVTATGPAALDGGPGPADRLALTTSTFAFPPTVSGFESVAP